MNDDQDDKDSKQQAGDSKQASGMLNDYQNGLEAQKEKYYGGKMQPYRGQH